MNGDMSTVAFRRRSLFGRRKGRGPRLLVVVALATIVFSGVVPAAGLATVRTAPTAAQANLDSPSTCGAGNAGEVAGLCSVTIDAHDFATGSSLTDYSWIINLDNTKLPTDQHPLSTESNSPIVRTGDAGRKTVNLPNGRYLVSVRSLNHKMWGAYFTLPRDAHDDLTLTVRVDLTEQSEQHPLPLGKIRVFVFNDTTWTNGAPDTEEPGLQGFKAGLVEQTDSAVTVDYNNHPLCGGVCETDGTGFVEINDLGPATYFIDVHPPDGPCNSEPDSQWYQTTTIDGGLSLLAPVEEGADGTGAPGEQLWEPPNNRTAYWFGFVCAPRPFATPGTGEIVGTARNWVEWAPYTTGTFTDPVENPFVALSDSSTDQTLYVGQGDAAGNFDIQNVPAGDYNLSVWDEQLTYIMRFKPVTVAPDQTVDVNETGDDGSVGLGVSRWFGWLDGTVYKDKNGNGKYDPGVDAPIANTDVDQRWRDGSIKEGTFTDSTGYYVYPTAEGGALGRWIVGEQGFARFSAYPGAAIHDERDPDNAAKVIPSCSTVDPVTGQPVPPANPCIPNAEGGGLLVNQLLLEGHRATVDWGKRDYPAGTPGQIVGITYFATTRNEFNARFQAHEDYEPAVPDVLVYLETPGTDGLPNTADDVIVNSYLTDHWVQPSSAEDPLPGGNSFTQSCAPIRDLAGNPVSGLNPNIGPNCYEVPLTGQQTKEGKFDGGYAFADYCPNGLDEAATDEDAPCWNAAHDGHQGTDSLVAGDYIVHVIMPTDPTDARPCNPDATHLRVSEAHGPIPGGGNGCLYHVVREEDVNVDLGNQFAPQIPPPPCSGDDHAVDKATLTPRSPLFLEGDPHAPLCDKHLVVLQNGQNANADFNMMTNFRTDPNGEDAADHRTGDVAEPGRLVGQVFNDIYFERNLQSPWYGEPRPIGNIPVGIYARVDVQQADESFSITGREVGRDGADAPTVTYGSAKWRLLTTVRTSPDGSFEALVPSTETLNCPIPQGPCPGMYLVAVDDPGFIDPANGSGTHAKSHATADYNPNLLAATTPAEAWPGLTTQLDLPLDPISGTACQDPAAETGPARPELLQVSRASVPTSGSRGITIQADFIGTRGSNGASGGHVNLTDLRTGTVFQLTGSAITQWAPGAGSTPDQIGFTVPSLGSTVSTFPSGSATFRPGPMQVTIITSNGNGAVPSVNGITLHVLGSSGGVTYTPTPVNVPAPTPGGHELQNAIDSASAGNLLLLSAGTYNENVFVWKPLRIQGLGPGGIIGAHEFGARDPEDPRFNIHGTVIDGRFFAQNATTFDATTAAHHPTWPNFTSGTPSVPLRGAAVTVAGLNGTAFDVPSLPSSQDSGAFGGARIDGLGITTGHGDGAGGIEVQANASNLQITNDVLENNGGVVTGGIGLGQPYVHASNNHNVRIANDRLIGNGGLTTSGGIGIFYDSNNYEVARSIVCSNFSVEYGAGISHIGLSPNGSIHDNQIYYNDAVDSGAGIAIESELPRPVPPGGALGDGSGAVNVDRNLIQSNFSGDDGGGIFVLDALDQTINLRNNMIVDNGAADMGGAIVIDDSSRVAIVNNTVANNVSTGSSENSAIGHPHSAGLATEKNEPLWQSDARYAAQYPNASTRPAFSNPVALFNNIFWNNDAMTLDQFGPGATLVDEGFIDFEVRGTSNADDHVTPRFSDLTNGQILGPDGALHALPTGQGNISSDPGFVTPFTLELTVSGSRLDPQQAAVTITGADPPVGLTGDYHVTTDSPVIDRGAGFSDLAVPAPANQTPTAGSILAPCSGTTAQSYPADFDRQLRPYLRASARARTPWDIGADELTSGTRFTIPRVPPPGSITPQFNWNGSGQQLQCSASTETR